MKIWKWLVNKLIYILWGREWVNQMICATSLKCTTLKRLTFNIRAQWLGFCREAVIAFPSVWSSVFSPRERPGCFETSTTSRNTLSEGKKNCESKGQVTLIYAELSIIVWMIQVHCVLIVACFWYPAKWFFFKKSIKQQNFVQYNVQYRDTKIQPQFLISLMLCKCK